MATDQDEKTTGAASGINYNNTQLDNLTAKFDRGDKITASDINTILDYYADFKTHTHSVTDLTTKDTFGNTDGNQTKSTARDTTNAKSMGATPSDVSGTITAVKINEIVTALNTVRTHLHTWNDTLD